ncbi:unnamed protein product [Leptosia nina]|uniref:Uncharacterized protein n=1 Tax=Leptosia nina TaxID=320188 RepID=A0AAV1IV40_9NEOP
MGGEGRSMQCGEWRWIHLWAVARAWRAAVGASVGARESQGAHGQRQHPPPPESAAIMPAPRGRTPRAARSPPPRSDLLAPYVARSPSHP